MTRLRRRPLRLRTQLALAMAICVFTTVVIGYFGLTAVGEFMMAQFRDSLPADARRAWDSAQENRIPNLADLEALWRLIERAEPSLQASEHWALAALSVIAALLGAGGAFLLSLRLAEPLEALTLAAKLVTAGDLSARAEPKRTGAGEIAALVQDFNAMAAHLEAAEKQLRERAAATAHELRTPLMILQSRLEALSDGLLAPSPDEYARLIAQTRLLARIVEDLRTLSLAQAGRLMLQITNADLGQVAGETLAGFTTRAAAAGVRVSAELAPAPIEADVLRLTQTIAALIDNALRYAAGGRELRVETAIEAGRAVVRVLDRGPGPPELDGVSVFDAFVRGDASRSRDSGGSGLGLAVVRAIVEAHGGEVAALPRVGGGAEFRASLPLAA